MAKIEEMHRKLRRCVGCQVAPTVLILPTLAFWTFVVGALFEVLLWESLAIMLVLREGGDRPVCATVHAVIPFRWDV